MSAISKTQRLLHHDACGRPDDYLPCLPRVMHALGLPVTRSYTTFASAYMIVRASAILRVPLSVYWQLLFAHLNQTNICGPPPYVPDNLTEPLSDTAGERTLGTMPYVMERVWEPLWSCDSCSFRPQVAFGSEPARCQPRWGRLADSRRAKPKVAGRLPLSRFGHSP